MNLTTLLSGSEEVADAISRDFEAPPLLDLLHSDGHERWETDPVSPVDPRDDRYRFESLLTELTFRSVNLPLHEIDAQIADGLKRLVRFLKIDRASFAEFTEGKSDMVVTHSYAAFGILPFPRVPVDGQFPWYTERIRRGELLRFCHLPDEIPSQAVAEREYCLQSGIKSNLAIPLRSGGSLNCVITFDTFRDFRTWPNELVQHLWLIGEVFAGSVARKRAEEKTQLLHEQLTRLARVTLVGELAGAIAHEVNQPLCAIVSNAQAGQRLLSGENTDLEELRETLQDIAADGRRATDVVARIRGMLQKQTPARAPLDVSNAIREVVSLMYGPAMQKGVTLTLQLPSDLPLVLGDRVQLQQVVLNLALNALDAMTVPEIETRHLTIQARCDAAEGVIVTVRDTGAGIEPPLQDEIFEAFVTTKPTGLGVGLAISRSIVESHGGRIWVESEPGCGATFRFALPDAQEEPR